MSFPKDEMTDLEVREFVIDMSVDLDEIRQRLVDAGFLEAMHAIDGVKRKLGFAAANKLEAMAKGKNLAAPACREAQLEESKLGGPQ